MRRACQVLHPPDICFPSLRRIVDDEHAELHEPEVVPAHRAMLLDAVAEAISGLRFLADARPATYRTRDRAHRKFAVVVDQRHLLCSQNAETPRLGWVSGFIVSS